MKCNVPNVMAIHPVDILSLDQGSSLNVWQTNIAIHGAALRDYVQFGEWFIFKDFSANKGDIVSGQQISNLDRNDWMCDLESMWASMIISKTLTRDVCNYMLLWMFRWFQVNFTISAYLYFVSIYIVGSPTHLYIFSIPGLQSLQMKNLFSIDLHWETDVCILIQP